MDTGTVEQRLQWVLADWRRLLRENKRLWVLVARFAELRPHATAHPLRCTLGAWKRLADAAKLGRMQLQLAESEVAHASLFRLL